MLQEGQVVQLKSGGPLMTVMSVEDNGWVKCVWFDAKDRRSDFFKEPTLELAD